MFLTFHLKSPQVEELWTLDDREFENLGKCHGLIFLFKMIKDDETPQVVKDDRLDDIFFAKQVKYQKFLQIIVVYFYCLFVFFSLA